MRVIKKDLRGDPSNPYTGDVKILPLADFHIGDPHADIKLVKKLIAKVEETPNMYTILNGDLMNTAIMSSVSDTYDEQLKPSEQLQRCVDYFGNLAEAGKILGITDGNHERRISKSVGVDMTELMALQLGLGDVYDPGDIILFLSVGLQPGRRAEKRPWMYSVFARHGAGGGAMKGGKVNRLQRFSDIADADVFIGSHTHDDIVFHDAIFRADSRTGTVTLCDRTYVNTPAALGYGGYGEVGGFRPQSNRHWPIITLHGDEKFVTVES